MIMINLGNGCVFRTHSYLTNIVMRFLKKISILLIFIAQNAVGFGQHSCDIIEEKYYDNVAKAVLNYKKGNFYESYIQLKTMSERCELSNSTEYSELYVFAKLSIRYKDYDNATSSIKKLVSTYGYKLSNFTKIPHYQFLRKHKNWREFKKQMSYLEHDFVSDTALVITFQQMGFLDQSIRIRYLDSCKNRQHDSAELKKIQLSFAPLMDSIDSCNCHFLVDYLQQGRKPVLSQSHQQQVYFVFLSIVLHCATQPVSEELSLLLKNAICSYQLSPVFYAALIDRKRMSQNRLFVYGFYDNITEKQIEDFPNIDKQRFSIGLPAYSTEKELKNLKTHNH